VPQLADTQIGYYIRLTRIQEWWEKLLHLAGSAFLLWTYTNQTKIDAIDFSVYVTAVFCLLLGGYTINDAADFYQDKAVGRIGMPERQHSLSLSLVSLTVGLGLIFSITSEILPRVITIVTILIGVQYSLPPLRFKERRIWGVIVGAVTQKPAIFLIFVAIIGVWNWLSVVLTIWLFCGGMLGMLGHQILDYKNDNKLGVGTFAVRYGPGLTMKLSIVCAVLVSMMVLMPLVFLSFSEALPVIFLLAAFSSIYPIKGLRSLRKIRSAGNIIKRETL